jgi:hypothetical protein
MGEVKRIIIDATAGDLILQVRAAKASIADGRPSGDIAGIVFEDGKRFGVKWNKDSVRVYPQAPTPTPAEGGV